MTTTTDAKRLDAMIAKYGSQLARKARAILRKARALAPGAVELVYDNYNALVIAFAGGERTSDASRLRTDPDGAYPDGAWQTVPGLTN